MIEINKLEVVIDICVDLMKNYEAIGYFFFFFEKIDALSYGSCYNEYKCPSAHLRLWVR